MSGEQREGTIWREEKSCGKFKLHKSGRRAGEALRKAEKWKLGGVEKNLIVEAWRCREKIKSESLEALRKVREALQAAQN